MRGDLACIALRTFKTTIIPLQYHVVEWMLQAFLASEPVVTSGYKWLSQCIMDKSDSLGNELGPLKGVTGIALPITQS